MNVLVLAVQTYLKNRFLEVQKVRFLLICHLSQCIFWELFFDMLESKQNNQKPISIRYNYPREVDMVKIKETNRVKIIRAYGGCLGSQRR